MKGGDEAATLNFELREKQESGKLGRGGSNSLEGSDGHCLFNHYSKTYYSDTVGIDKATLHNSLLYITLLESIAG